LMATTMAEVFAVRPYPLDETTWTQIIFTDVLKPMAGLIGVVLPSHEAMFPQEDSVIIGFNEKATPHPTLATIWAPARLLWLAFRNNPAHARTDSQLVEAQHRATALESRDLKALSWQGLLSTVREALALAFPLTGQPRVRYLPRPLLAAGLLRLMLALLKKGDHIGALFSGIESDTLAANRALEGLAAHVRADSALSALFAHNEASQLQAALASQPMGRAFLAELQSFMDRYGHRDTTLSTALRPTWKDAPELVLGMLKGFTQTEPRPARTSTAWAAARDDVLTHPLLRLSPMRSIFLGLLKMARYLWQVRENSHFDLTRILPSLRRSLLEMGRRLVEVGVLLAPEDVFHLKFDELERVGPTWPPSAELADELRTIATRRKAKRAALEGKPFIDPRLYRQAEPSGDVLLHGIAGSPGVAGGPVRIIRHSAEFDKLRAGEILVAPYTNPSWTPLFQRAIAVVVDAGSSGSHAAIVAREYGIPAVMGSFDGTQQLVDGQQVRVDGNRGLVLRAEPIAA
jgi:rifampicin phosphotransferase